MSERGATEFVAECMWPDVHEDDLRALDQRATEHVERLAAGGVKVRYLGSMLMREDEVVLCFFEGGLETVRDAASAAQIPFDRILETARSPWGPEHTVTER
ncbi:MAG TPA: hypothetical protein VMB50_23065 [Myxococcales bacterium]|jgi:hypothetical protein|nr:hypothetical protein [Myxococcales bacterium]